MTRPRPQAPDENEGAYWEAHGEILGDIQQDEEALARSLAFHIGQVQHQGSTLYLYRAQQPAKCKQCAREIAEGELFFSHFGVLPTGHQYAICEGCRNTGKKGRRAA